MGLGYVLCRAADTIADTDLVPAENRKQELQKFLDAFNTFPVDTTRLKEVLPPNYQSCAGSLTSLSSTEQTFVQNVVIGVINGMMMDLKTFGDSIETLKPFKHQKDLEKYLAYIGGEPGRFWTNVLLHHGLFPESARRDQLIEEGIAFGKGLQMVNILKDFPEDAQRGRCYIPLERLQTYNLIPEDIVNPEKTAVFLTLYHELILETVGRLRNGLSYLSRFRRFDWKLKASVWWPLALGLQTLTHLRSLCEPASANGTRKIKRSDVYKTMLTSLLVLPSEKWLKSEFERLAD